MKGMLNLADKEKNNSDIDSEVDEILKQQLSESDEQNIISEENSVEYENISEKKDKNEPEESEMAKTSSKKKRKKNKSRKKGPLGAILFVVIIVSVSLLLAALILGSMRDMLGIFKSDKEIQVEIPEHSSVADIADILAENDVIEYPILFRIVAKANERGDKFNYGIFTFNSNMPYEEIMNTLEEYAVHKDTVTITIVEGENIKKTARKLERSGVCSAEDFIDTVNRNDFGYSFEEKVENNPLKFYRMEGYVYPDTYEFFKGQSPELVCKTIFKNFDIKITNAMYSRMEDLGMTLDETITLASMIQAEAANIEQMKMISGVFHNRLNNSDEFPRLESDPTKKYVREVIKPASVTQNQEMMDAYDTYVGKGLPPGAICSPGLDAINAALYPDDNDYYYFCSNLETKECFYAKSFAQHNINLEKAGLK